ncbi:Pr6Pr family membrane protein [Pseudonocardia sp. KRD-291]|nr:Pr6Pr family membrane protein [Pseudonocardia sp. KRD291]
MLLRVAIVVAVLLALVLVETSSRSGVLWRLTTFTYQVNVLAAAFYAWSLVSSRADTRPGLRGAVVLYVVVAGLVWNVFLTDQSMGYTPANVLLHVVMPVLAMGDWLLVGRSQGDVRWWQPIAWLAYPVAYLGLALAVLNEAGRRAPYYFLDPGSVGAAAVAGNIGLLALGFVGLGYVISALGRVAVAARPEPLHPALPTPP